MSRQMYRARIERDITQCVVMTTVAVCAGLAFNALRPTPMPLVFTSREERLMEAVERVRTLGVTDAAMPGEAEPEIKAVPEFVSLEEFGNLASGGSAVVLDARPEIFFRMGHVPGAVSLPRDDFDNAYPSVAPSLDPGQWLLIYCASASCEDSELLKQALQTLGYHRISIFKGGWAEWQQSGNAEAGGGG